MSAAFFSLSRFRQRSALAALCAAALALAACSSARNDHPLQYAPHDSLFVVANLEPLPKHAREFEERFYAPFKRTLAPLAAAVENSPPDTPQRQRLQDLLLPALRTAQTEGLAGFGIDEAPLFAAYEIELRPVLRVTLKDAQRTRQFIGQLAGLSEPAIAEQKAGDASYWAIPLEPSQENAQENLPASGQKLRQLQMIVGVVQQQLVIALDQTDHPLPVARLLGLEKPAQNMHQSKALEEVNRRHGFLAYGATVWLPTERHLRLLEIVDKEKSLLNPALQPTEISQITALVADLPEIASGITHWDARRLDRRTTLVVASQEMRDDLATLPGKLPAAAAIGTPIRGVIEAGTSLQLDKLAAFIQKQWQQLHPRYEVLQGIDSGELARMLAPLYAVGSTANGLYMRLTEIDLSQWSPDKRLEELQDPDLLPHMAIIASTDNPRALLSYIALAMELPPQLSQMQPGAIVPLSGAAHPSPELAEHMPAWLGMGQNSMGMGMGKNAETTLKALLDEAPQPQNTLLMARYNGTLLADAFAHASVRNFEQYEQAARNRIAAGEPGTEQNNAPDEKRSAEELARESEMLKEYLKSVAEILRNIQQFEGHIGIGKLGIDHHGSITLAP